MLNICQGGYLNKCHREESTMISLRIRLLSLYLFFAPLDFLPIIPGVSVSRFLIFLPLVGAMVTIKKLKMRIDRFLAVPILYVMVLIITGFYSYDTEMTINRIFAVGTNVAVILILSMFHYNEKEICTVKRAMALSGWLVLLLMIFYSDNTIKEGRFVVIINGVFQDPNYLTGFLIFPIIYYLDEFLMAKKGSSIVKLSSLFILILLTGSRGGLLAIFGSIMFYCFLWFKLKGFKISTVFVIIGFLCVLGILLNFMIDSLPETVAQRYELAYTLNDGAAGRTNIWKVILYNFENSAGFHKLFGWGAGTITHFTFGGNVAHNVWLEALIELGTFGLAVLLIFYFMFFIKAYQIKEYAVTSVFAGYMIMTMSLSLYSYKPIWNIILLIIILKNYTIYKTYSDQ